MELSIFIVKLLQYQKELQNRKLVLNIKGAPFSPNKSPGCSKIGLRCTKIGPGGHFLGYLGYSYGTLASNMAHIPVVSYPP